MPKLTYFLYTTIIAMFAEAALYSSFAYKLFNNMNASLN